MGNIQLQRQLMLKDYGIAFSFFLVGVTALGAADVPAGGGDGEIVEMVPYVVTGSQLLGDPERPPLPLVRIGGGDLLFESNLSPIDALRDLPAYYGYATSENDGFTITSGSAGANLLGLGQLSTLTLVNGRRAGGGSAFGFQHGGFADLNLIPSTALSGVEVVTGGGSVAHGSDGIAGTVNLLLDSQTVGQRLDVSYGNTTDEDAAEKSVSFTSGHDLGKTKLLLFGSWYERNAIHARDRDLTRTVDRRDEGGLNMGSFSVPGIIATGAGAQILREGVDIPASAADYRPLDFAEDPFNFAGYVTTVPAFERKTFMANVSHDLTGRVRIWGELLYSGTEFRSRVAPAFWAVSGGPLFDAAVAGPHNPVAPDPLFFQAYRSFELGNVAVDYEKEALRGLAGLRGKLGNTWNWETALLRIEFDLDQKVSGVSDQRLLIPSIDDGSFNPFARAFTSGPIPGQPGGSFDNAAALRAAAVSPVNRYEEGLTSWDFKVRGEPFELPAGFVSLAAGLEAREETVDADIAELFESGNNIGWVPGESYDADRAVRAVFAEARIPLFKGGADGSGRLEMTVGGRYEDYEDEGDDPVSGLTVENSYDSTVYRAGLSYDPVRALNLRASFGTAFRAPTLHEGFANTGGFISISDPDPSTPPTSLVSVNLDGNPDLDPEESQNLNLGFTFEPDPGRGLRLSVDYYHIVREDAIFPGAQALVNENRAGQGPGFGAPGNYDPGAPFADRITRNAAGTITGIDALWLNAAEIETDGILYELSYRWAAADGGDFEVVLGVNQVLSYDVTVAPGAPSESFLGDFVLPTAGGRGASPGSIPEYRGFLAGEWSREGWRLGGRVNYVDSLDDVPVYTTDGGPREIDEWWSLDLFGSYAWGPDAGDWLSNTVLRVGVENVTDEEPPFIAGVGFNPIPTDTALYSVAGRRYTVSLSRSW